MDGLISGEGRGRGGALKWYFTVYKSPVFKIVWVFVITLNDQGTGFIKQKGVNNGVITIYFKSFSLVKSRPGKLKL